MRPHGSLTVETYRDLTAALMKYSLDEPDALIVELDDLCIASQPLLAAFATAWMRVSDWPSVPILLVAGRPGLYRWVCASAVDRFVCVYPTLTAALAAIGTPPPRRRARTTLASRDDCGQHARRFVTAVCDRWRIPPTTSIRARVVATELVENAYLHARGLGDIILGLESWRHILAIAVSDNDSREAILREPRPGGDRCYGLYVVADTARAWGCTPRWPHGKTVWATLSIDDDTTEL